MRLVLVVSLLACSALATPALAAPPMPPTPPTPAVAFTPPTPPTPPGISFSFATGQGRLGAQVSSMTPELRAFFGAPKDRGILVHRVTDGTPAADAGLAVGDVVIAVDGEDVEDVGDVMEALADRGKGDRVEVVVVRKKKRRTLSATLDEDSAFSSLRRHHWSSSGTPGRVVIGGDDEEVLEKLEAIERRLDALEGRSRPAKPTKKKKKIPGATKSRRESTGD